MLPAQDLDLLSRPERMTRVLTLLLDAGVRRDGKACGELLALFWTGFEGALSRSEVQIIIRAFRVSGFVTDHPDAVAPTAPLKLYRGAVARRQKGLSWTSDVECAQMFALRQSLFTQMPAFVYEATVTPDFVLGHFTGRKEVEWVVDPAGLHRIRRVSVGPPVIAGAP